MVIAIIAILAAMLMPALNKSREKSRTASCLNSQKQLGLAVFHYADDYRFVPPALHDTKAAHTILRERKYISNSDLVREKGCSVSRPFDSDTANATEEMRSKIGYNCLFGDLKANGTANSWGGYEKKAVTLEQIKAPGHKVMWIDSAYKSEVCILMRSGNADGIAATNANQWSGAGWVHNGNDALNICMADGHAVTLRLGEVRYHGGDFNAPTWESGDCGYYFTPTIKGK